VFDLHNRHILITGGTGSFGKACAQILLERYSPQRLIIFSRDELKQHEMRVDGFNHPSLRYFVGDVRDAGRLKRAMVGVDVVIHAAALKQVPACEYNPIEAIKTNIDGGTNVIEAALDARVQRVVALSTDKAVNPINLYGATKLVAEKLFVQANAYRGGDPIRFGAVRYGNVVGSRGSVVPLFRKQRESGVITITDPRMTRFWLTLESAVQFVIQSLERMQGGEVFVPKIPSMKILDLAQAIASGCRIENTGIRAGEKLHEVLLSEDEARHTVEFGDFYVIEPMHPWWKDAVNFDRPRMPEGFRYSSETNSSWLAVSDLQELIGEAKNVDELKNPVIAEE
jgi:UDP-N-acetylglucosamine 4,6-dehydratase